mmetsp:Transcript_15848/g.23260  ORF Transcript_15848/g.23260 Transcript_15848/m.23260 type:complete len:206 (-) Transcript_15848:818-1435(-)
MDHPCVWHDVFYTLCCCVRAVRSFSDCNHMFPSISDEVFLEIPIGGTLCHPLPLVGSIYGEVFYCERAIQYAYSPLHNILYTCISFIYILYVYILTFTHPLFRTHAHTRTYTHHVCTIHTPTHRNADTPTHTQRHTKTYTPTFRHTSILTGKHTHTHTHTDTHTQAHMLPYIAVEHCYSKNETPACAIATYTQRSRRSVRMRQRS